MLTRSLLVSLAMLGLVWGGQAMAQDSLFDGYPATTQPLPGNMSLDPTNGLGDSMGPLDSAPPGPMVPDASSTQHIPLGEVIPESEISSAEPLSPTNSFPLETDTWDFFAGAPNRGPFCEVCGAGECFRPTWYTRQEVRIMGRNSPSSKLTTTEMVVDATFGNVLSARMTASSVPFDVSAGYAMTLGRYLGRDDENRDRFLEFSYWGLNNWTESKQANGIRFTDSNTFAVPVSFGSLFSPFAPGANIFDSEVGGFNRADTHTIRYQTDIDNFELNIRFSPRGRPDRVVLRPDGSWRRECQPGWHCEYLAGIRVTTIDEMFALHSEGDIEYNDASHLVSGDYTSRTQNDLIGLQFGIELMQRQCKYTWGIRAKAGPYINCASQNLHAVNDATADPYAGATVDFRRTASADEAAFLGEVGLVGTYRFRPNVVLRASYDLLWAVGLATASDQMDFSTNPTSTINADATGLFHGLSLGFDWMW